MTILREVSTLVARLHNTILRNETIEEFINIVISAKILYGNFDYSIKLIFYLSNKTLKQI